MRNLKLVVALIAIVWAIFVQIAKMDGRDLDIMINVKVHFSNPPEQRIYRGALDIAKGGER